MQGFQLRKQLIIGALAVLLVADVAFAYFNLRTSGPRADRELALTAQAHKAALVRSDVERARKIREKLPQTLKEFDQFESTLLPTTKGYSALAQEMDDYAKDTRILLDDVRFREKEVSGRNLTELVVESRVSGDYNGIVRFLNHLQRSKNVFIVDALDVETDTTGQAPVGVLRVNLHMRTYFRKA